MKDTSTDHKKVHQHIRNISNNPEPQEKMVKIFKDDKGEMWPQLFHHQFWSWRLRFLMKHFLLEDTEWSPEWEWNDLFRQTRSDLPIKMITLNLIVQKLFIISLPIIGSQQTAKKRVVVSLYYYCCQSGGRGGVFLVFHQHHQIQSDWSNGPH